MAKPLRSEDPRPRDTRLRDFGVLDTGARSKSATTTSITVNVLVALLVIVLGAVVKTPKKISDKLSSISLNEPPPPPPKPIKMPPPPKLPPPPKVEQPKIEPPKIVIQPKVELPKPDIKPMPVVAPKVNLAAPAPKKVDPPPAPKVVNLANAAAAHIANNDAHPSAVRMGNPEIRALNGPTVATPVNLAGGIHGMPPGNTGSGPHATNVSLGSGSPLGSNLNGRSNAAVPVAGLRNGTVGGTGNGTHGPVVQQVSMGQAPPPAAFTHPPAVAAVAVGTPPRLTYKPTPNYTEEARSAHLEGNVTLRIRVSASGAVQVLGVVHGLGHGLDQSAQQAAAGMRFTPAKDSTGRPIDWEGPVTVLFQLS